MLGISIKKREDIPLSRADIVNYQLDIYKQNTLSARICMVISDEGNSFKTSKLQTSEETKENGILSSIGG